MILATMCSLGWGKFWTFDWNDLPMSREFDSKFLKNAKSGHLDETSQPCDFIALSSLRKVIKALHTLFASENLGGEVDL